MYLLRKGAYRDISHIILKHTISNKLTTKVSAQKKGGESYDSYNVCVQISVVSGVVPPVFLKYIYIYIYCNCIHWVDRMRYASIYWSDVSRSDMLIQLSFASKMCCSVSTTKNVLALKM